MSYVQDLINRIQYKIFGLCKNLVVQDYACKISEFSARFLGCARTWSQCKIMHARFVQISAHTLQVLAVKLPNSLQTTQDLQEYHYIFARYFTSCSRTCKQNNKILYVLYGYKLFLRLSEL